MDRLPPFSMSFYGSPLDHQARWKLEDRRRRPQNHENEGFNVFPKWNRKVTSPKWSGIILRSFWAILVIIFTIEMAPDPLVPKSAFFRAFPASLQEISLFSSPSIQVLFSRAPMDRLPLFSMSFYGSPLDHEARWKLEDRRRKPQNHENEGCKVFPKWNRKVSSPKWSKSFYRALGIFC